MMITVRVTPNSKKESVKPTGEGSYAVKVREKAIGGRANSAVVKAIAGYFNVSGSAVLIVRGLKGREKSIEITLPGG